LQGVGRLEASIDHVHIENSCEHFKAELGKNQRVLRPNLGAVDNVSRRNKRVSEMQVNGIARTRVLPDRAALVRHPTYLTALPSPSDVDDVAWLDRVSMIAINKYEWSR
jgi:hypothetical protein